MPLPTALIESLRGLPGFDEASFEEVHASGRQIVSVRLNPKKFRDDMMALLPLSTRVPWSGAGYYLSERPSFTLDPLFHAGAYYVQEASSMFLEEALRQCTDLSIPLRVLDLCAAPGGKSSLVLSLISNDSLLVSNEVIKSRNEILEENLSKWGSENVIVTNNDPADFKRLPSFFDIIITDAPCSGSGMFRKDPASIGEWSLSHVDFCSLRQQRILADVLPSLKPGGLLIYSTCSYSEKEDEAICDYLAGDYGMMPLKLKVDPSFNIIETASAIHSVPGYRFYPDRIEGEGFFITVLRKKDDSESHAEKIKVKPLIKLKSAGSDIEKYGLKSHNLFEGQNQNILYFPEVVCRWLPEIKAALYVKKAGVQVGELVRGELLPHPELALSLLLDADVPSIEVDRETALKYLRREHFELDTEMKGWVLIKYLGLGLGWAKLLPGRINNYYPKSWRILNK